MNTLAIIWIVSNAVINAFGAIILIDHDREPITPLVAAFTLVWSCVTIAAVVQLAS